MSYELYTDGGCRGNPGIGGWGYYLITPNGTIEDCAYEEKTTNNQMELTAVIEGLRTLPEDEQITVYTDSTYVKNGITKWIHNWRKNGWKAANGKPVKNKFYWVELHELTRKRSINWKWVKGHSTVYGNNKADELCNKAMDLKLVKNR